MRDKTANCRGFIEIFGVGIFENLVAAEIEINCI